MHRRPRLTLAILFAALVTAAAALFYTAAAVSYHTDPRPARDVAAELNAPWSGVPESQRAAPAYQRLNHAWQAADPPKPADPYFGLRRLTPAEPTFPATAALVRTLEPQLADARAASRLPTLGADFRRSTPEERAESLNEPTDEVMLDSAIFLRIPGIGHASTATALLLIDADHAAITNDPARFAADIHATLAIARQVREIPILIADIVALRAVEQAATRIRRALAEHPGLLDDRALAALQTDLATTSRNHTAIRPETERLGLTDILDRTFSPGPNGRITEVGIRRLDQIATGTGGVRKIITKENAAVAPLLARTIGTRAEHLAWQDELITRATAAREQGPAGVARYAGFESDRMFDPYVEERLVLAWMLHPALASALYEEHRVRLESEATGVAIALERHRLAQGTYPTTLGQLIPDFLEALPKDPFDLAGGPIKYRLTPTGPTLYFNGANLHDDNASPPVFDPNDPYGTHAVSSFNPLAQGQADPNAPAADWVIFPDPAPIPTDQPGTPE